MCPACVTVAALYALITLGGRRLVRAIRGSAASTSSPAAEWRLAANQTALQQFDQGSGA